MTINIDGWFISEPSTFFPCCEICEENEHEVCFEPPEYDPQIDGGIESHYCTCIECSKEILPRKCFLWVKLNININMNKEYFTFDKNER